MQTITTIGLDIAKSVFQVHGIDAQGKVIVRRQLKRRKVIAFFQKLPPCLVGIEACASSHYWSRELQALGHRVDKFGLDLKNNQDWFSRWNMVAQDQEQDAQPACRTSSARNGLQQSSGRASASRPQTY